MKTFAISLLLMASGLTYAAEPAPGAAKPAAPTGPAASARAGSVIKGLPARGSGSYRDPAVEVLTPEELTKYQEAMRTVMKDPAVIAAQAEAVKAQEEVRKAQEGAMRAMAKVRAAREAALKSASAEMPAIMEKVEAARKKWIEEQRAKFMGQRPGAQAGHPAKPGAPTVPAVPGQEAAK